MSEKKELSNICIITAPRPKAGVVPLSNLIDVLSSISHNLYVVTGNEGRVACENRDKIQYYLINYKQKTQIIYKIFNSIYLQLRISHRLLKLTKNNINIWIFFMGEGLLFPLLTLKLLRKNIVLNLASSSQKVAEANENINSLDKIVGFLETINYRLSNHIIIYSSSLIKEWNLEKYIDKISIASRHFLDLNRFKIKKRFEKKEKIVGYIGRLSEEKGTMSFVRAVPEILKEKDDIKFLICGEGQLREKIATYLEDENLNDAVKLVGWIVHNELPEYINELKLIVLPSYTEGLPNILLEAMACGTLVLATQVGGIPDIIKDGETGFIMENSSPECVARNVLRALAYPNLEVIIENAKKLIEREFTCEAAVEKYKGILGKL